MNLLIDAAVASPPELILSHEPSSPLPPPIEPISTQEPSKQLLIEGQSYYVVSATLKVIDMLQDYVRVVINLMRSAGLKNITAKHLG